MVKIYLIVIAFVLSAAINAAALFYLGLGYQEYKQYLVLVASMVSSIGLYKLGTIGVKRDILKPCDKCGFLVPLQAGSIAVPHCCRGRIVSDDEPKQVHTRLIDMKLNNSDGIEP